MSPVTAVDPGADLGFYKGGCPIHHCAPSPENFSISYIKMVSFYAFPVIFIDTVLFKKGTLIKRVGVRTPGTPPGFATCDRPPTAFKQSIADEYYYFF